MNDNSGEEVEKQSQAASQIKYEPKQDELIFPSVTPFHLIFFSSLPLCIGAYAGYRVELSRAATSTAETYAPGSVSAGGGLIQKILTTPPERGTTGVKGGLSVTPSSSIVSTSMGEQAANATNRIGTNGSARVVASAASVPVPNGGLLAAKALGIGTMLSIGGVGLLTAGVFKLSGCKSLDELIETWREWTPKKRKELEQKLGVRPKSLEHEDVKQTAGMTEAEEWEFIKQKYIPELVENDRKDSNIDISASGSKA